MLESSRSQWADGHRRLEAERVDPVRHRQLLDLVGIVTARLRRRLGSAFTLAELDAVYQDAERWATAAIGDAIPAVRARVTLADAALVLDAACHAYGRGAVDYEP